MEPSDLGWNETLERHFAPHRGAGRLPARICRRFSDTWEAWCSAGSVTAVLAGRLRAATADPAGLPVVGDWVALERPQADGPGRIRAVLPRRSCFSRREAGHAVQEQVLAANIDVAFLVTGLDRDFNVRRIERYLLLARDSDAAPVILLNKADLCRDPEARRREVEAIADGTPVHPTTAREPEGIDVVRSYLRPGRTIALFGSSGVGKSTMINTLLGEERQRTGAVRADDDRGRHHTTVRELLLVPDGGLIIDTPGLREVQLWLDESSLAESFADVEELATRCRFRDCRHEHEPGCAVRDAAESGLIDAGRLRSFHKLRRELLDLERRSGDASRRELRAEARRTGRMYKRVMKAKRQRRGE